MKNPVLSARIAELRSHMKPPPDDEAQAAANRLEAETHAAYLTRVLRDAGEPSPEVQILPETLIGPCAVADIAGYPLIASSAYGGTRSLTLMPRSYQGVQDLMAVPSVESLAVQGDPDRYARPDEFGRLLPGDPESPIYHVSALEQARQALAEHERERELRRRDEEAHERDLRARFSGLQYDLATTPMFGGVTFRDWLAGMLCSGSAVAAATAISEADQLIRQLRSQP